MITRALAEQLRTRGLRWTPASGDRFMVPDRDLDEEVFLVSQLQVDVADVPTGNEMRFNGSMEWALDSIEQREVVWLPREDQLRAALGSRFQRLEAVGEGFAVVLHGLDERFVDIDPERAYARALLAILWAGPVSPLSRPA